MPVGREQTRTPQGPAAVCQRGLSRQATLYALPQHLSECGTPAKDGLCARTGLDSFAALNVMEHMSNLAGLGHTVIASIHQPRSAIWEMFDKVTLTNYYSSDSCFAACLVRPSGWPWNDISICAGSQQVYTP